MVGMNLFGPRLRSDVNRKQPAETLFAFIDRCGRPAVARVRELLEGWFAAYPATGKEHLRGRLMRDDGGFHGAFFELYLLALFRSLGLVLELPLSQRPGQKTEDFQVYNNERLALRVEAKHVGQEEEHARQDLWERDLQE